MRTIEVPKFVRGLIFDCDGTLVDSMPLHMKAWEHAIRSRQVPWDPEFFQAKRGTPEEDIVLLYNARFGVALDPVDTVQRKHRFFRARASEFRPIPQVVEVVLRHRGILPMAVASGGVRRNVELELEAIGVKSCFEAILTADDDLRPKPAPDIFIEAARRLGVSPADCQVFEDGDLGLQAARAAGMLPTDVRLLGS